jgi:D-alanine-D-alanine ligase
MFKACFLFGGKSFEHEVSVSSMRSVLSAYFSKKFIITIGGLDLENRLQFFSHGEFLERFQAYGRFEKADRPANYEELKNFDVVFPLMHGDYVEDGSLQGLFTLFGVPFVGPNVLASSICMDKEVAKRLLVQAGLKVADWIALGPFEMLEIAKVTEKIGYPCFVKPASSGSSCGVSKVHSADQLEKAVLEARRFSKKVLIEKAINGMELECAVLGLEDLLASRVGQIIPQKEFYDYESKYLLSDAAVIEAPANIPDSLEKEIRRVALKVFKVLECEMMGRIDFFYDGELYVSEVNTIPGFTPISLYPKLLELTGIGYNELIDQLLEMAIRSHLHKERQAPYAPNSLCLP